MVSFLLSIYLLYSFVHFFSTKIANSNLLLFIFSLFSLLLQVYTCILGLTSEDVAENRYYIAFAWLRNIPEGEACMDNYFDRFPDSYVESSRRMIQTPGAFAPLRLFLCAGDRVSQA